VFPRVVTRPQYMPWLAIALVNQQMWLQTQHLLVGFGALQIIRDAPVTFRTTVCSA
jgi:hypothetical protein